ncbi:hypothetical protein NEOLEDRAFT_1151354 [Neolentinus lepideus HHB14362 ss-1]|uniref:Uncharacterized protein n=1 Tax=Neolentinus lepideus HHB14362 ss-1 TaxID=1314782 RepID=A0A165P3X3_9AGAM|nr:hypothetical protein NEOLEDRAFT_1151354 [Neolentinus lepideus HHB14362 ss-1]
MSSALHNMRIRCENFRKAGDNVFLEFAAEFEKFSLSATACRNPGVGRWAVELVIFAVQFLEQMNDCSTVISWCALVIRPHDCAFVVFVLLTPRDYHQPVLPICDTVVIHLAQFPTVLATDTDYHLWYKPMHHRAYLTVPGTQDLGYQQTGTSKGTGTSNRAQDEALVMITAVRGSRWEKSTYQ